MKEMIEDESAGEMDLGGEKAGYEGIKEKIMPLVEKIKMIAQEAGVDPMEAIQGCMESEGGGEAEPSGMAPGKKAMIAGMLKKKAQASLEG